MNNKDNNLDIFISRNFEIKDVENLIDICNYEPFYDTPDADDILQYAAYIKDYCENVTLVGFISCLLNTSDSEVELTAMVRPDMRKKGIFTRLFKGLNNSANNSDNIQYANNNISNNNFDTNNCTDNITNNNAQNINSNANNSNHYANNNINNIKYIVSVNSALAENINATSSTFKLTYLKSEYLMTLQPFNNELFSNNISNKTENTKNISKANDFSQYIKTLNNNNEIDIEFINEDNEYLIVNTLNDDIISSIEYEIFDTHICIHDVWTFDDYRHKGFAFALFKYALNDIQNNENTTKLPIILHVSKSNIYAVALYKKLGMTISEEVKYYNLYSL